MTLFNESRNVQLQGTEPLSEKVKIYIYFRNDDVTVLRWLSQVRERLAQYRESISLVFHGTSCHTSGFFKIPTEMIMIDHRKVCVDSVEQILTETLPKEKDAEI